MSGNTWEAIGAIATVLALLLSIASEWKRVVELYASFRSRSISAVEAARRVIIAVTKRAWRPVLVILSVLLLGIWGRSNLLVQPIRPLPSWTFLQYVFTIAQVVPLGILIYVFLVEPWRRTRRMEQARNSYVDMLVKGVPHIPVVPIVFYDETFPCSWVTSPEKAVWFFEMHGFLRANASELKDMMERVIEDSTAYKTVFVFIHDIVPISIAQVLDPSCMLKRYLDAGGRVVWWGDIPLHLRGLPGQMREKWAGGPAILSVNHYTPRYRDEETGLPGAVVLWSRSDLDGSIQLTDAGRAIGMTYAGKCIRPAAVDQNTVVYSEIVDDLGFGKDAKGLRWAISWRKVYNERYPHSGFMQYPLDKVDCNENHVVGSFFRFAVSDWPLAFVTRQRLERLHTRAGDH